MVDDKEIQDQLDELNAAIKGQEASRGLVDDESIDATIRAYVSTNTQSPSAYLLHSTSQAESESLFVGADIVALLGPSYLPGVQNMHISYQYPLQILILFFVLRYTLFWTFLNLLFVVNTKINRERSFFKSFATLH